MAVVSEKIDPDGPAGDEHSAEHKEILRIFAAFVEER